jgi:hypothetical protein
MRREDLSGNRFGELIALRADVSIKGETKWVCACDCGTILSVYTKALKRGMTRTCGHNKEHHGSSSTREYATFRRMQDRCSNKKNADWLIYGGRGIRVAYATFSDFLSDVGDRPSEYHSIDRINVNGNYEPGNCRWATSTEQANNRRTNRLLMLNGETLTMMQWSRRTGISRETIEKRIDLLGWAVEAALTIPVRTDKRRQ